MTTPANRAPKFVVVYPNGVYSDLCPTEEGARTIADRCRGTVHPIGPALPAPAPVKAMGEVVREHLFTVFACEGIPWSKLCEKDRAVYEAAAAAVIAAHEAGRETETVVRWAVFDTTDGTWWDNNGEKWSRDKNDRTLFPSRELADHAPESGERLVKVTTTRRRRVAP